MVHDNPFVSAFIGIPEFRWKNRLRHWLAFSPLVPDFIQDYSPIKGYEKFRRLQEGDVVVDAGAFPGDYCLYAAKRVGPEGRVYALEPGTENRRVLQRNLDKSRLKNVTVIPKGLWDREAVLRMREQGLASRMTDNPESGSRMELLPLDQLVHDLGLEKLNVLKMDIEGAELQALAGARETLRRFKPYTCVASYHVVEGETTAERVESLLREAGLHTRTDYAKHLTTYGSAESLF